MLGAIAAGLMGAQLLNSNDQANRNKNLMIQSKHGPQVNNIQRPNELGNLLSLGQAATTLAGTMGDTKKADAKPSAVDREIERQQNIQTLQQGNINLQNTLPEYHQSLSPILEEASGRLKNSTMMAGTPRRTNGYY